MAKWKYEGFDKNKKKVYGSEDVKDERELKKKLRLQGIRWTKLSPPSLLDLDLGEWMVENGLAAPFGQAELSNFTRQMSVLINAGVPIMQALEILFKQEKHPTLKKCIKQISQDVGEGKSLSESMEKLKGFSRLYCNLIKAGESGGILDTILDKLAIYMDKQEKIKSEIKGALTYPAIVTVVGVGVIMMMLVFVVPMFMDMVKSQGKELPAITQFVIDASDFMKKWFLYMVLGGIGGAIFLKWFKESKDGKPQWDTFVMKLPLFGNIVIKGSLSSFTRTLSTMMGAGVPLIESLEICASTIDNSVIGKDILKVRDAVVEGKTLTEPLLKINYFPELVSQMIKVGESTGQVDQMLEKVANIFEKEVEGSIGIMTKLMEPMILVGLGGAVAVILIAMYMPMFTAAN